VTARVKIIIFMPVETNPVALMGTVIRINLPTKTGSIYWGIQIGLKRHILLTYWCGNAERTSSSKGTTISRLCIVLGLASASDQREKAPR